MSPLMHISTHFTSDIFHLNVDRAVMLDWQCLSMKSCVQGRDCLSPSRCLPVGFSLAMKRSLPASRRSAMPTWQMPVWAHSAHMPGWPNAVWPFSSGSEPKQIYPASTQGLLAQTWCHTMQTRSFWVTWSVSRASGCLPTICFIDTFMAMFTLY